jgi:hypothetical protein
LFWLKGVDIRWENGPTEMKEQHQKKEIHFIKIHEHLQQNTILCGAVKIYVPEFSLVILATQEAEIRKIELTKPAWANSS